MLRWEDEHPDEMRRMVARGGACTNRSTRPNYRQLMAIYEEAIEENQSRQQLWIPVA